MRRNKSCLYEKSRHNREEMKTIYHSINRTEWITGVDLNNVLIINSI